MKGRTQTLVLYDGYCVLCNGIVQFILPRMQVDSLEFESLQSKRGQAILKGCGLSTTRLDTFVLYEGKRCHVRSTAVLKLTRYLRFPWPLLYVFIVVPEIIRNPIYNWVARKRYDWFGRLPGG